MYFFLKDEVLQQLKSAICRRLLTCSSIDEVLQLTRLSSKTLSTTLKQKMKEVLSSRTLKAV